MGNDAMNLANASCYEPFKRSHQQCQRYEACGCGAANVTVQRDGVDASAPPRWAADFNRTIINRIWSRNRMILSPVDAEIDVATPDSGADSFGYQQFRRAAERFATAH
jgi:hypothetical protein